MGETSTDSVTYIYADKFICARCKNPLSVPPIYSFENGMSLCGRCFEPDNATGFRNSLYEAISQFQTFSCMNKKYGCLKICTGKDMYDHEVRCSYRRINCTSCDWIGEVESLLEHFEDHHPRKLLNELQFEIDFVHDFEEISLLPYADHLFFLKQHGIISSKVFHCSLLTVYKNESQHFEYSIMLKNSLDATEKIFAWKPANSLKNEDGFTMNTEEVQKELNNPSMIIATVEVREISEEPLQEIPKLPSDDGLSATNLELLKIIECPVCLEYMVPPIFQCPLGHSICGECKSQITRCPSCTEVYGDTKNYDVEKITALLKYPCKNIERGCDFYSEAKTIKQHEKACIFRIFTCPSRAYSPCPWSGKHSDIWKHCTSDHKENVMVKSSISIPFTEEDCDNNDEDFFVFKSYNDTFILHYKFVSDESTFYWSTQLIGLEEDSKNYYFDLDLIDRSGKDSRLYMKTLCESFSESEDAFEDGKSFLCLSYDQVKPFINDAFSFRVSVLKKN